MSNSTSDSMEELHRLSIEIFQQRFPALAESFEQKTMQAILVTADDETAWNLLDYDLATHEERQALAIAMARARFEQRRRQQREAYEARPRWRRLLGDTYRIARANVQAVHARVWGLLRCRLGRHVWWPIHDANIIGEFEPTGHEVCVFCERERARPVQTPVVPRGRKSAD